MNNLISLLAWVKYFAQEYGPILMALNAIWSLFSKIRALFVGTSFGKERD